MSFTRRFRWSIVFCLVLLGNTDWAAAQDRISSDRRLPANVYAYVSLPDVQQARTQWGKTAFARLLEEESVQAFRADVDAQWQELSKRATEKIGLSLTELLSIPHGEAAFAITVTDNGVPGFVMLLDFGDKQELVQKLLDKGTEYLIAENSEKSEEEFEQTRLTIFTDLPESDEEEDSEADDPSLETFKRIGYFVRDTTLAVGSIPELQAVITRWDGEHDSTFADNEVYRYIMDKCRTESEAGPTAKWYVSPVEILKKLMAAERGTAGQPLEQVLTIIATLGVDSFRGIGGTYALADGEYDSITRGLVYLEPPVKGLLNVFQFPARSQTPPKWVSSRVASYNGINWDLEKAYTAIESIVDGFQGAGTVSRLLDQLAQNPATGNLHAKKDFLDHLSGKFHIVSDFTDPDNLLTQRYLIAFDVKNTAAMKTTLAKVANLPGFPGKTREFQGEALYEVTSPGVAAHGDANDDEEQSDDNDSQPATLEARTVGFTVTEGCLMFASNVTLLEQVLRGVGDQEQLVNSPSYQATAEKFPSQTSLIGFQKQDLQIRALYQMLQSSQFAPLLGTDNKLDFSKLPPYETIQKFLTPVGTYMQPDDRGLFFSSYGMISDR